MRFLDNMTVRLSWTLVLLVFAALLAVLSGLGLYAVNNSQASLHTFNMVNVEQQAALNRANSQLLSTRLALKSAYLERREGRSRD